MVHSTLDASLLLLFAQPLPVRSRVYLFAIAAYLLACAVTAAAGQLDDGDDGCGTNGADECRVGSKSASSGSSIGGIADGSGPNRDFFRSYATAWVQAEMLQDEERTRGFREAIHGNRNLFEGKVVLDVGAGTGILSLFAAQAGASRVFAVERSDMASIARRIAADNQLDHVVQVIQGLIEEVELPVSRVDIIMSEWIGTFLVHESMLDSVLFARDKWLARDGVMLPDSAELYVAGVEDQGSEYGSWNSFYGLDFSALGTAARLVGAQQCLFRNSLATQPARILALDLYHMTVQEQVFSAQVKLPSAQPENCEVHALAAWFNLSFFNASASRCAKCSGAVASLLTTHPSAPCTHWQQTLFSLEKPLQLQPGAVLDVDLSVHRAAGAPRDLDVDVSIRGGVGVPPLDERFHIVGAEL